MNLRLLLFIIVLPVFNFYSQINLDIPVIRKLNVKVIHYINLLPLNFSLEDSTSFEKTFYLSNDIYPLNKNDTLISYKDYFSGLNFSYKEIPKVKFKVLDISLPKETAEDYQCEVLVKKFFNPGKLSCVDVKKDIVLPDTITQLITLKAKLEEYTTEDHFKHTRWIISLLKIETIDPKGRRVKLKSKGSEYYFKRFGLCIPGMDTCISAQDYISNPDFTPYYYVKNLQEPILIGGEKYENYYDLFNQNTPIDNACEQAAEVEVNAGRYGYASISGGLDVGIAPAKLNINASIVPVEQISINRSRYYNAHFVIQQTWYWKLPLRIVTGIGYSNMQFSFESAIDSHQDVYQSVDADGGSYIRTVNYANMSDRLKLNYHAFPIQLGLDVQLLWNKMLWNKYVFKEHKLMLAGAFTCTPMFNYKGSSERSANINYSGTYTDLFNITIGENGVYDFGNYSVLPTNNEILDKANLNWCIGLDLGLKCFIKDNVFASIMANYSLIPTSIFPDQENEYLSKNNSELNSYLTNISDSELRMWSVSMNVGFVIPKKNINGEKEEF